MFKRNLDIKEAKKNVPDYVLAERLGISENTFYRWLRKELPAKRKELILQTIVDLTKELQNENKGDKNQ